MGDDRVPDGGARRVLIEGVTPLVDGGRYAVKRIAGDDVRVACDLLCDGHDVVVGRILYRRASDNAWQSAPLVPIGNDRCEGSFVVTEVGAWEFTVEAWTDAFDTWCQGTARKRGAGQPIDVELLIGGRLLERGAARSTGDDKRRLAVAAGTALDVRKTEDERWAAASSDETRRLMAKTPDLTHATRLEPALPIVVDPKLARFGAWYELFPRSAGESGAHGTFADVLRRLDDVADMGFDVLYMPPIHPIGHAFRKGPNNSLEARGGDPGSPWAIGSERGGHKAVHPELGTIADFRTLVREARARKIELALDIAFQVSPDHPYVREHPEWFVWRPDGTVQYAENPPKKYQDVLPFDFECNDWQHLWRELLSIFTFWISEGVRVFRVDNPHTKSLRFWEWCIGEIKARHPDVILLAEAFTRPKIMYFLAKAGFSQSYTYFTWRHTKAEFEAYLRELTTPPVADFYRPNFWPNTPDILPEDLQRGDRAMYLLRLLLAATLSSNYGIYGPPFELMEYVAREGAEEYANSEKYELRTWNWDREASLRPVIRALNEVRRASPALQQTTSLTFHRTSSDAVLAFSKSAADDVVLVLANLDVQRPERARIDLTLPALGVDEAETFRVRDLLNGAEERWTGPTQHVTIDPTPFPVKLLKVTRRVRTEKDFEYYL